MAPAPKKAAGKRSVKKTSAVGKTGTASLIEPSAPTLWGSWDKGVDRVRGIGPARAAVLGGQGISTLGDLLYYFPRRYVDRTITENAHVDAGMYATVFVRVESRFLAHGRKSRLVVHARTPAGQTISLVWFRGVHYMSKLFEAGQTLVVSGRVEQYGGLQMAHPDFEIFDPDEERDLIHVGRIIPLYPSNDTLQRKGFDSRGFRRGIAAALETAAPGETLPAELLKEYNYMGRQAALQNIHFPESAASLQKATDRLKYEELYLFGVLMHSKQKGREAVPRHSRPMPHGCPLFQTMSAKFPFTLTADQKAAIETIVNASQTPHPFAFLLQGDVGSGKTAVAVSVALHYMEAGIQAAIMAPTEVLARQHYRTMVDLLGLHPSVQIELLTAQDSKKAKEAAVARIAAAGVNLVIGTHSLIEEKVRFHNLGFVIIDEQHRFGVDQREALMRKGKHPDLLAMTATPIPRTLCLTEFADLRLVTLREKPAGRKPIKTMWFGQDKRAGVYKSIRKHVGQGRQCYIVYPVIEDSEKTDLRAATDAYEELRTTAFPDFQIELLHGRMKSDEKDRVMREFRQGSVQILVSTTVIEVGIDIPNATIMVIEHADRFGISQLHQLRGRVGRGSQDSFCVLMADNVTDDGAERLQAVRDSQDGFYLAEVDLKIRGAGELLGTKQHGAAQFRLADLVRDNKMAEDAYNDARRFPDLNADGQVFLERNFPETVSLSSN